MTYHKTGEKRPVQEDVLPRRDENPKKKDEEDKQLREPRAATLQSGYQSAVPQNKQPSDETRL